MKRLLLVLGVVAAASLPYATPASAIPCVKCNSDGCPAVDECNDEIGLVNLEELLCDIIEIETVQAGDGGLVNPILAPECDANQG